MKSTNQQKGAIAVLINKLGLKEQKGAIVAGFSSMGHESTKELTEQEARQLIMHLKTLDPDEKKCEKLRKTIISMAHEMGYRKPGTTKVDMVKLDDWCVNYGKYKKKLNQHKYDELLVLQWQFKQYHDKFIKEY